MFNPESYEGLLPDGWANSSSTSEGHNDSILILANLDTDRKSKMFQSAGAYAHKTLSAYFRTLQSSMNFHTNGGVRLLVWTRDDEKSAILPRSIVDRKKLAVLADLNCHIEEIAGAQSVRHVGGHQRESAVDYESHLRVAKRMAREGTGIPLERLDTVPRLLQEAKAKGLDLHNPETEKSVMDILGQSKQKYLTEMFTLQDDLANGVFQQFHEGVKSDQKRAAGSRSGDLYTPQYRRLTDLLKYHKSKAAGWNRRSERVDELEKIYSIGHILRQNPDMSEETRKEKMEDLQNRIQKNEENMANKKVEEPRIRTLVDERRALSNDSPILQWDGRTAEPIQVKDDEFDPPNPLTLLDFRPRPSSERSLTPTAELFLEAMTVEFFVYNAEKVADALDKLAPGASAALIPKIDSLKNLPFDLEDLRVRTLTTTMLIELATAWSKWPFRPSRMDLLRLNPAIRYRGDEPDQAMI